MKLSNGQVVVSAVGKERQTGGGQSGCQMCELEHQLIRSFVLIVFPSAEGHGPSDLQYRDWKLARVIFW